MMQPFRHSWLLLVLALGCATKDESTATDTDTGTDASTTGTTAAATTVEPTTTVATTSTGTTTADSTTGTTAELPNCETSAEECGVMVSDVGSFCPDTPPAKDELKLEPLGPGKLRITEVGRDSSCNISFNTIVTFAADHLIIVTYEILGQPEGDCICKFEVTTTLSNLAPGTWDVLVGSWEGTVDVP